MKWITRIKQALDDSYNPEFGFNRKPEKITEEKLQDWIEWINEMAGRTTKDKIDHYHLHIEDKKYALRQIVDINSINGRLGTITIFELTTKENLFALINAYAQGMYIKEQIINLKQMEEMQWEREEAMQ